MKHLLLLFISAVMAISLGAADIARGQEIGLFPVKSPNSPETVFLVDGDTGTLVNFIEFKEEPLFLQLSEDKKALYALSRHYGFKVDVETALVLNEYQYMDIMNQQDGEMLDPNSQIIPMGLTKSGIGFYSYNEKARQLRLEAQEALKNEDYTLSSQKNVEAAELASMQPVSKVDIDGQATTHYRTFNSNANQPAGVTADGHLMVWMKQNQRLRIEDTATEMIIEEVDFSSLPREVSELAGTIPLIPQRIADDIFTMGYMNMDRETMQQTLYNIYYKPSTDEILSMQTTRELSGGGAKLQLTNTDRLYYGNSECNVGPMPAMPSFTPPEKTGKKAMARWKEEVAKKQQDHKKALDEWTAKNNDISRCRLTVYNDPELTDPVLEVPEAKYGTVHNNNTLVVFSGATMRSYSLATGRQNWTLDLDY